MDPALFAELRKGYRERLKGRIETLEAKLAQLESGESGAEEDLRRLAHTLRGSGGSYGYPEISESAAPVELGETADLPQHCRALLSTLRGISLEDSNRDSSSL